MIKEIEHFIPDNLCDKIIDTFKNQLVTAETFNPLKEGGKTKMKVSDIRVASNYFFDEQSFPEILPLKNQISKITNIPIYFQEQFCLIKYTEGGKYDPHYDSPDPDLVDDDPRMYSFIFYLNDDYKGGETHFPDLDNKHIKPKKGKMVYWRNFDDQQDMDHTKIHAGLPVTKGTKWILTLWVRDINLKRDKIKEPLLSTYIPLPTKNYGYSILKVPNDILKYLKYEVDKIQNNFSNSEPFNHELVGEIKHEYRVKLEDARYKNFIFNAVNDFETKSEYFSSQLSDSFTKKLDLTDPWVNFQKKGEYNPVHRHEGIYSYVIWYQIPFYHKDEMISSPKSLHKITNNGDFNFHFTDINTNPPSVIVTTPLGKHIDKSFEGHMAIFPSSLCHSVYPFYSSDKFRITFSGNINLYLGGREGQK